MSHPNTAQIGETDILDSCCESQLMDLNFTVCLHVSERFLAVLMLVLVLFYNFLWFSTYVALLFPNPFGTYNGLHLM